MIQWIHLGHFWKLHLKDPTTDVLFEVTTIHRNLSMSKTESIFALFLLLISYHLFTITM